MNDSNSVPARIVIAGTATMKLSDRFKTIPEQAAGGSRSAGITNGGGRFAQRGGPRTDPGRSYLLDDYVLNDLNGVGSSQDQQKKNSFVPVWRKDSMSATGVTATAPPDTVQQSVPQRLAPTSTQSEGPALPHGLQDAMRAATSSTEQPTRKRGRPPKSHKSDSEGPPKAKRPRGRPPGKKNKDADESTVDDEEVVRSQPLETQTGRVSKPPQVFNVARPEFKDGRGRKKGSKGVGRPRKSLSGTDGEKRGRGRPPKKSSDGSDQPKATPSGPKRGRGRPPKAGGSSPKKAASKPSGGGLGRGRGRPPKSATGPKSSLEKVDFSQNAQNRVQLYVISGQRKWKERGIGLVACDQVPDQPHMWRITVRAETAEKKVLVFPVKPDVSYRKEQGTVIVWSENETRDLALSFEEEAGCSALWERLCHIQGKDPTAMKEAEEGEADEEPSDCSTPGASLAEWLEIDLPAVHKA